MVLTCNYTSCISNFLDIPQKQFSNSHISHTSMHTMTHTHTHTHTHQSHLTANTPTYMQCMFVNEGSELGHPCVTMYNGMIGIRLHNVMNRDWWQNICSCQSTKIQFSNTYIWSQTVLQLLALQFTYLQVWLLLLIWEINQDPMTIRCWITCLTAGWPVHD